MHDVTESILADQVRAATHPDDIMSALHAARPGDRADLLNLRGLAMLRNVARLACADVTPAMTKPAVIAALVENF